VTSTALRPAEKSDVPVLTAIYRHYVLTHTATFELEPPDEAEMARRLEDVRGRDLPWWVATAGAEVLGYCYAAPYRARPAYRYTLEDSIYLAPEHVGRGLGRALLEEVIRRCAASGYRELIAVVGDSENVPSIRLHEKLGFTLIGTHPRVGFKFGRWLDTVHLQRSLA
jgi:L-amino acid N-acyltransferase YncA